MMVLLIYNENSMKRNMSSPLSSQSKFSKRKKPIQYRMYKVEDQKFVGIANTFTEF